MTRTESYIFTFIMCALMVSGMSLYNIALLHGIGSHMMSAAAAGFLPAYAVGLICDTLIVARPAKALAFKIVSPEGGPSLKLVLTISFFMVCGMVLCMSFYGAAVNVGFSTHLPLAYLRGVGYNFIAALPLQLLIVGPLTRFICSKLFPVMRKAKAA